jgi:hypothetical protein
MKVKSLIYEYKSPPPVFFSCDIISRSYINFFLFLKLTKNSFYFDGVSGDDESVFSQFGELGQFRTHLGRIGAVRERVGWRLSWKDSWRRKYNKYIW